MHNLNESDHKEFMMLNNQIESSSMFIINKYVYIILNYKIN